MDPLKAARVFPRIEALIDLAAKKRKAHVHLTTPVHAENLTSALELQDVFGAKHSVAVHFTSASNRCWDEGPFRKISLAPVTAACGPKKFQSELFVDWDGIVVPCCFDFSKSMPLGNLSVQTLEEVFESDAWSNLLETFRRGEWSSMSACSKCRLDQNHAVQGIIRSVDNRISSGTRYEPVEFRIAEGTSRGDDGSTFVKPCLSG